MYCCLPTHASYWYQNSHIPNFNCCFLSVACLHPVRSSIGSWKSGSPGNTILRRTAVCLKTQVPGKGLPIRAVWHNTRMQPWITKHPHHSLSPGYTLRGSRCTTETCDTKKTPWNHASFKPLLQTWGPYHKTITSLSILCPSGHK